MKIVNLREQPHYLQQIAEWHHQEWAALNPGQGLKQRIEFMQNHLNSAYVPSTYIAINQNLMGSASVIHHDMESEPELSPWLASVFVVPEYRSHGVGSLLVRHVMQEARKAGISVLYLFTPDQEAFYQKLGWQVMAYEDYRDHRVAVMKVNL